MVEVDSKAQFEKQVADICAAIRLEALKIANCEMQMASLESRKKASLEAYQSYQTKLQGIIELAREVLGLEPGWTCALDVGLLIPPPPNSDETP